MEKDKMPAERDRLRAEIQRLQKIVTELLPFAQADAESGELNGFWPVMHDCDPRCETCQWYNESVILLQRIHSGEFDITPTGPLVAQPLDTKENGDRILWNRRPANDSDVGEIDEIVCRDVTVHVEQMNDSCWWIGLHGKDDHYWSGNFFVDNDGKMCFGLQDDWWEWDFNESHQQIDE